MKFINCPHCGAQVQAQDAENSVWHCQHCSHSLLLETLPNIRCLLYEDTAPLIAIGTTFAWQGEQYHCLSYLRFHHPQGIRTEWAVKNTAEESYCLIVDDEHLFLVQAQSQPLEQALFWESLQPNTELQYDGIKWLVTEQLAMQFDQASDPQYALLRTEGSTRRDIYLVAENAETLILTFTKTAIQVRRGFWLDPFDIEVRQ